MTLILGDTQDCGVSFSVLDLEKVSMEPMLFVYIQRRSVAQLADLLLSSVHVGQLALQISFCSLRAFKPAAFQVAV